MPAPTPATGTCLVHLVWAPLGPQSLAGFLETYRRHAAGPRHRLLVVFNGFRTDEELAPWRELLAEVEHEELLLARPVLDLAAYGEAVARFPAQRYCFLNSYSRLLADGWLSALERALALPGVGLVAASGSWGSQWSHTRYHAGLGGPYGAAFDDPVSTHRVFAELVSGQQQPGTDQAATPGTEQPLMSGPEHPDVGAGARTRRWQAAAVLARYAAAFPAFPAPHVRTNSFLINRELWLRVCRRAPHDKLAAYRMESGRQSITNRVKRAGLRVLVVGRDERAYEPHEWPQSETFWQASQENLLVGDNQTRAYEQGSTHTRLVLSRYAWGPQAAPDESQLSEAP